MISTPLSSHAASPLCARLQAALDALSCRADALALEAFSPLFWEERLIGRLAPSCAEALAGHPALAGDAASRRLMLLGRHPGEAIEALGATLREAGLAPALKGEAIDLFLTDEAGAPDANRSLGAVDRSLCRPFGLWTRAVRVTALLPGATLRAALMSPDTPALLLSRRSKAKRIGAGLWDSLAAGMVQAGEAPCEAMRREAWDEAGLPESAWSAASSPREAVAVRPVPEGGLMREVTLEWVLPIAPDWTPENRDGEASGFAPASVERLLALLGERAVMPEAAAAAIRALLAQASDR